MNWIITMILIRAVKLIHDEINCFHSHSCIHRCTFRETKEYTVKLKYYSQINGNNKLRRKTPEKNMKYRISISYCSWVHFQASLDAFWNPERVVCLPHSPVTAFRKRKSRCCKLDMNVVLKHSAATVLLVLYIRITASNAGRMWPSSGIQHSCQNIFIAYGTVSECEGEVNF
jgi:hypothetical protein